jgi:membrane fusion protein, multidrug efflux system
MNAQPPESPPTPAPLPPHEPPRRRMSRRGTILGSLVAIAVIAGIGWLAWDLTHPSGGSAGFARNGAGGPPGSRGSGAGGRGGGSGGAGGPATTVGVAVAQRADVPVTIDALGTVVPTTTVRVRPQVSGVLQKVLYKEGQMVRAGQLLAVIDPRQFELTLQQATGQRMRDEAQLQAARVTLARYETLLKQDSIARQDVDTQRALVQQLEANIVVDKANEGTARLNLSYTRITSPVSGRVGLRPVDVGNIVSTSDANGVALVTQLNPIDVQFAIPQEQAADLQANAGGFMEAKALDRTRTQVLDVGVFSSLDNQVDVQTGTVRAKARFNNTRGALFPSQFVNVQLNVRTIHDAIVVPVTALRHGSNGDYVFVLQEDRTVKIRPVKAGQQTNDKVQITNGLQVGERVITEGADRLRDGSRVVLPGDNPAAGRGPGGGGGRRGGLGGAAPGASQPAASSPGPAALGPKDVNGAPGQRGMGAGAGGGHRRRGGSENAQPPATSQ